MTLKYGRYSIFKIYVLIFNKFAKDLAQIENISTEVKEDCKEQNSENSQIEREKLEKNDEKLEENDDKISFIPNINNHQKNNEYDGMLTIRIPNNIDISEASKCSYDYTTIDFIENEEENIILDQTTIAKNPDDSDDINSKIVKYLEDTVYTLKNDEYSRLIHLFKLTDNQIESLLSLFFVEVGSYEFYELIRNFMLNPLNEFKIIDAMLFILNNPQIAGNPFKNNPLTSNIRNRPDVINITEIYNLYCHNLLRFLNFLLDEGQGKGIGKELAFIPMRIIRKQSLNFINEFRKNKIEESEDGSLIFESIVNLLNVPEIVNNEINYILLLEIIGSLLKYIDKTKNESEYMTQANAEFIENQENLINYEIFNKYWKLLSKFKYAEAIPPLIKIFKFLFKKENLFIHIMTCCKLIIIDCFEKSLPELEQLLKLVKNNSLDSEIFEFSLNLRNISKLIMTMTNTISKILRVLTRISVSKGKENIHDSVTLYQKRVYDELERLIDELKDNHIVISVTLTIYEIYEIECKKASQDDKYKIPTKRLDLAELGINFYSIINLKNDMENIFKKNKIDIHKRSEDDIIIHDIPQLSRLISYENNDLLNLPQLTKSFSQYKRRESEIEIDYHLIFCNFAANCSKHLSTFFLNTSKENKNLEMKYLVKNIPWINDFQSKITLFK